MAYFDSYYAMSVLSKAAYAYDSDFINELGPTLGTLAIGDKQYIKIDQKGPGLLDLGFSAYVFEDISNSTAKTISFRGTVLADPLDLAADKDILINGVAMRQIVDMYNYVSRLRGTGDVTQYCQ